MKIHLHVLSRPLAASLTAILLLGTVASGQAVPIFETPHFDARVPLNAGFKALPDAAQRTAEQVLRHQAPGLAVTWDPSFGTARTLTHPTGYLSGPDPRRPAAVALDFLHAHRRLLGLTQADLAEYEITDTVVSRVTGATHLYLRQVWRGIPVDNGQIQVHVNRAGRILGVSNGFVPDLAGSVNLRSPAVDGAVVGADLAVLAAAAHLDIDLRRRPAILAQQEGAQRRTRLASADLSAEEIPAELRWLPIRRGQARLVWHLLVHPPGHAYEITVDATTAEVWTRFDRVTSSSYRVYAEPVESPNHTSPVPPSDARSLIVSPADPLASPLGWHDDGTVSYTIPRGNNVHAYEDSDANGAPPAVEPDCGGSLDCDFPIDLGQQPSAYRDAAVANLFYWNNLVHDVQYRYGFDEAAGNFQVDNFGRGGAGGDDVRAEAQDGGGSCNANFYTPSDGSRPRMQMYTCYRASPQRDGDLDNGVIVHEYGHGISIRQVGGPSNVSCLWNRQQPGEGWSDWLALVYTAEPGDQGSDARGMGTYLFGQPADGPGIRPQPYSTDPAVNDYTYASINGLWVPHGVGSVWAQALWEVYWALVGRHGFDPDLSDPGPGAGNHRALLYVNEGLKSTACSPTFVDARDGILQAANDNFAGEDVCLLWESFAAFGLGTDAVSGGSDSTQPTNGFEIPAECQCTSPCTPPELLIPANTAAAVNEPVVVPVELLTHSNPLVSTAFSVDYDQACLTFDPTDADTDGIPDAMSLEVSAQWEVTVFVDPSDGDGEIDVLLFADDPTSTRFSDGPLVGLTFTTTCVPDAGSTRLAPVVFSADPAPSFGNPEAQSVAGVSAGGAVEILPGVRGDCNGYGGVDAPDLTAVNLELFDGDGSFWLDVPGGTFPGSPVGCDANADTAVDGGDLSCIARLIFGQVCDPPSLTTPEEGPRLTLPWQLMAADGVVVVPVQFDPAGHAISSVIFSLAYDQSLLAFNDTDGNGDGIPDAVRFPGPAVSQQSVSYNAADAAGPLDFVIADLTATPQILPQGVLVEVELELLDPLASVEERVGFGLDPAPSFGDGDGRSIAGAAEVVILPLFADGFESGDTSAWSVKYP